MTASDKAAAALDELYAEIPDTGCKGLCVEACGPIGMTPLERQRIADRGTALPLLGKPTDGACTALSEGRCAVYECRPTICRLWGAVESLPCPHGCVPDGGRLPDREGHRIIARAGVISRRAALGK